MPDPSLSLPQLLDKYSVAIDLQLHQAVVESTDILRDMLNYQLAWRDEQGASVTPAKEEDRLHALLCLLTCDAIAGRYDLALPAAAAVELIHHQAVVHEDIQVGRPQRGDRSTLWWLWGPGQAINAGDGLHALGRLALMKLGEQGQPNGKILEALQELDVSCLRMCEGQHMDLVYQDRLDVTVEQYTEMASLKTGSLLSCASKLGAMIAVDNPDVTQAFAKVGMELGLAYQIRNDILSVWNSLDDTSTSDNVLNKKRGLPLIYALQTAQGRKKRDLATICFKRVLQPTDVMELKTALEETQAVEYSQEMCEAYQQRAIGRLDDLDISIGAKVAFKDIGRFMALRKL